MIPFNRWPYTDYHGLNLDWVIQFANEVKGKIDAIAELTADAETVPAGSPASVQVSGGTGAENPYHLSFDIPTGPQGAPGEDSKIKNTATSYATSSSGTTIPTAWSGSIPSVAQGDFLWTRLTIIFEDSNGEHASTLYSVARQGVDGSGSVASVNNISPDSAGNVNVPAVLYTPQTLSVTEKETIARNIGLFNAPTFYVSPNGSDNNSGEQNSPFKTLTRAVSLCPNIGNIHVASGDYQMESLTGKKNISIFIDGDVTWTENNNIISLEKFSLYVNSGNRLTINGQNAHLLAFESSCTAYFRGDGEIIFNTPGKTAILLNSGSRLFTIGAVKLTFNNSSHAFFISNGSQLTIPNSEILSGSCDTLFYTYTGMFQISSAPANITSNNIVLLYNGAIGVIGNTIYPGGA